MSYDEPVEERLSAVSAVISVGTGQRPVLIAHAKRGEIPPKAGISWVGARRGQTPQER